MSGIDKAAEAFVTDMGGAPASDDNTSAPASEVVSSAEEFFGNREHEDDVVAGGDDIPDPRPADEEDDDGQDYNQDDEELDADYEGDDEDSDDEDSDDDDDEDEDEDEDEDSSPDGFESMTFDVIVDGQPAKVTGKEMKEGYIRQETFHQRLNKLSEAGRRMEQEATKLFADRDSYIAKLAEAEEMIEALVPAEPDWDEVFKANPTGARAQQKNYEAVKSKLAEIKQKKADAQKEQSEANSRRYSDWVRTQNARTMANNPSWSDPQKGQANMQRDLKAMAETARSLGFSDDEIKNTHDSRMISVLLMAAKYKRLQSKRPKPVNRGKPQNPGAGRVRTAPKGERRPQSLRGNGSSVDDAANVFGTLLAQEKRTRRKR